jgi:hypothetical protein
VSDQPATKAEVTQGRELIDGGEFKCNIEGHGDFHTADPVEWRKHCRDTGHTVEGEAPCLYCGKRVTGKFPYPAEGKPVGATCEECLETYVKPAIAMIEQQKAAGAQAQQQQPGQPGTAPT